MGLKPTPFKSNKSYDQTVDELVATTESPAHSYSRYTKAHEAALESSGEYADVSHELFGRSANEFQELRSKHQKRTPIGRLLQRSEKREIDSAKAHIENLADDHQIARENKNEAQLYKGMTIAAAKLHYEQNKDAYQNEALEDAARAGVVIDLGSVSTQSMLENNNNQGSSGHFVPPPKSN